MGIICKPYVHYLFIVCIINNMEFAYGYCDLKKMIKNVVSKMSNKGEIDKDTENKILESYRNVLKINISTESGYLTREGLLNSFYILFICFLEAYDISKTKILETTKLLFTKILLTLN